MAFDRSLFINKLSRYCNQLEVFLSELSERTGIPLSRLNDLNDQKVDPTGDEILIFADFLSAIIIFLFPMNDSRPLNKLKHSSGNTAMK